MIDLSIEQKKKLDDVLQKKGMRFTRQREQVYSVLMASDHPTAEEVYTIAKSEMKSISLATVYNCLETLVECGLVKQLSFDRQPVRYDPDVTDHAHFQCTKTGRVYDVRVKCETLELLKELLPENFDVEAIDVSFKGMVNVEEVE